MNTTCQHCGNMHTGACARVRAVEYYPDGAIKRVEYWGLADFHGAPVVVPTKPDDWGTKSESGSVLKGKTGRARDPKDGW